MVKQLFWAMMNKLTPARRVMFLLALQLQRVLGYSALAAGASLAPVTLMLLVLSPPAGRVASRIGPRLPMTAGPLIAAAGIALMSNIDAHATYAQSVLPAVLVFGLGLGFTVAPLTATAMALVTESSPLAEVTCPSGFTTVITLAPEVAPTVETFKVIDVGLL